MKFKLDYDKMLFLDAEDLAEAGIKEAYQSMMRALGQYVSEPAELQEVIEPEAWTEELTRLKVAREA